MTRLATLFTCSFRRLKEVRTVTVCAMLGAIAIVLGSLSIDLGPSVRIGFSGIPNELVHYLFGPAAFFHDTATTEIYTLSTRRSSDL